MKTIAILFLLFSSVLSAADQATSLLQASDQRRGGLQAGVVWRAKVETFDNGDKSEREFNVKALNEDAYVEALSPARNKGELFIFNGQNMWFYKPDLKKPVPISSRQKLSGQAANGDIASTNYAKNYIPTIEKTETVKGEPMVVLLLKAKSPQVTYDKIRYWISKKTQLAMKADFLTLQGVEFKHAAFEYGNSITYKGSKMKFVSKMTITDAQNQNNKSTIFYYSPKVQNLSPTLFNVNNLAR